ncbi:uncharacterized protein JCM6883_002187 [Sporobolomyces salmoneus]|uniref:uncharacterized protein n=1 Tax=Sporobolomyces salmoneus TaxID=183962 RepID=UPI00316D9A59
MLSTLPPELLREIIEATVPHSFHSTTYRARQKTLRFLSLVSKRFQAIAQPLLLEVVNINSLRSRDLLRAESGGGGETQKRGSFVKQAILFCGLYGLSAGESRNLKQLLSSVTTLSVCSVPEANLSLSSLKSFTRLTSLHLCDIRWEVPDRLTLPHLQSLTLYAVAHKTVSPLLNPVVLPNVRNLALIHFPIDELQPSLIHQLLPQIETLHFDFNVWIESRAISLHGAVAKTLIDLYVDSIPDLWAQSQLVPLSHLRIHGWSEADYEEEEGNAEGIATASHLDDFASLLDTNSLRALQTVYLGSHLQDSKSSYLRRSVENLTRVCQQNKIVIVFEEGPFNYLLDPHISPDFVRRQKEHRNQESRR